MISLVRAELRKYFTTRLSWSMPLAMAVLGALFAALQGLFLAVIGEFPGPDGTMIVPAEMFGEDVVARLVYTGAVQMGYLLALVLGILSMSGEFRHKTITATLLTAPRRGQLIAAKLASVVVIVAVNALAFTAGSVLGGGITLAIGDVALFPDPAGLMATFARMILVLVLWGLMGFGLGVLIPNQVVALFVGVGVTLLIEPLLGFGLTFVDQLADASKYFPSQASMSALNLFAGLDPGMAQTMGGAQDALSSWVATLVLLGYAVFMAGLGWILTARRDVA
ncbi:MAG: ABC transporter permease [Arsenicicoccus sp.]|uniref:ABC transporter permease n=1 Tax=Serinicoccus profundi TaxID=1078471 RepID=UPI000255EF00|nr:ABC transporter permease subunit [Serinicoccus profundi]PZU43639.1 MAG: ABC transporter permease [Arsenicicoccus sp.]